MLAAVFFRFIAVVRIYVLFELKVPLFPSFVETIIL